MCGGGGGGLSLCILNVGMYVQYKHIQHVLKWVFFEIASNVIDFHCRVAKTDRD